MVELSTPTTGAKIGKIGKTIVTIVNDDGGLIAFCYKILKCSSKTWLNKYAIGVIKQLF